MLHVVYTIVPVFGVILLGCLLRSRKFLPSDLIGPLNHLVYYLAIPSMIFLKLAGASFHAHFNPLLLTGTLIPPILVFGIALVFNRLFSIPRGRRGTFVQSSIHGNLGYIGLAVAFYLLGSDGLTRASILAGFLMLLQNLLSVMGLQMHSGSGEGEFDFYFFLKRIVGNPVVFSALCGIIFSLSGLRLPEPLARVLEIISGMALPLALLIIGASLSFGLIKSHLGIVLGAGLLKLLALPGLGLLIFLLFDLPPEQFLPALILLACPTATITYVMASEMGGSTELATASVSLITILSALTFVFWLGPFT